MLVKSHYKLKMLFLTKRFKMVLKGKLSSNYDDQINWYIVSGLLLKLNKSSLEQVSMLKNNYVAIKIVNVYHWYRTVLLLLLLLSLLLLLF